MEEHDLHASGFTKKEIIRIKRYLETGDSLDRVLLDLSRYFKTFVWVTIIMTVITILSFILGSTVQAISSAIAAVFLFVVFLLVMPVKVGYKSWKLLRTYVSDFDRRG
ncbi:hypothetical protein [Enterobacter sp. HSTU-ASh6]|uniref:hypothetical protein n=1 Tax=Enterobacter sp. HSTU-ASh6 TaxID=2678687 RepID=UPI0022506016|nr:hypothetical protein [Enterobacter sp. HSTU-ASh6]MCX4178790.1 hypothetical protein [Enterobacter sp. HSTU-ASh6]